MYNAEKFISKCISSIREQNIPSDQYEIIVINDGSTDNSIKIAEDCLKDIEHHTLLTQENQGQASARNKGIALANGKYLMFVDADDWLNSNTIGKLIKQAETSKTDIIISSMKSYRPDGTFSIGNDFTKHDILVDGCTAIMNGIIFGSVCARLFRRDFIYKNKLSFQTGVKHEDVLFTINSLLCAERIFSCGVCTYSYRWNEGSTDRSFDCENFKKAIFSDLYIANEIIEISKREKLNECLRNNLHRRGNSIIVGNMISLARSSYKRKDIVETYIKRSKEYGCYPIKGRTLSWKTTALIPIINTPFFMWLIDKPTYKQSKTFFCKK